MAGVKVTIYLGGPVADRLEKWRKDEHQFKTLPAFAADKLASMAYQKYP